MKKFFIFCLLLFILSFCLWQIFGWDFLSAKEALPGDGNIPKTDCVDSDNGKILEKQGTCEDLTGKITDYCVDDNLKPVTESQKIREYYCDTAKDKCVASTLKCLENQFCKNGVCVKGEALTLSSVPFHEDTSIKVTLNLSYLEEIEYYNQLGFIVYKENGIEYHPTEDPAFVEASVIRPPLEKKEYSKVIVNLKIDSDYEICLNGIKNGVTTGYFNCKHIRTEKKKNENVIIVKNYDVLDSEVNNLINQWIVEVKKAYPSLVIEEIALSKGATSEELLEKLREKYSLSNLKYVVLIGWDLPIPQISAWGERIYSIQPYQSLSSDVINTDNGFYNPNNSLNEVTVAVIRPEERGQMIDYFNRLIAFYHSNKKYGKRVLIANAMIPSELNIKKEDYINSRYSSSDIDYLNGITDYSNVEKGEMWQDNYKNFLLKSYEFLIIYAHGSKTIHYPIGNHGAINSEFIKQANPNALFVIAISCNIGNFMTSGSPMVSYIFDGDSLVGLGAEMPYTDINGATSKYIYKKIIKDSENIGDASRRFGFVIIGDPFIPISLSKSRENFDLNCDNRIDVQDLGILMSYWGKTGSEIENYFNLYCQEAKSLDLSGDAKIDGQDVSLLISKWGIVAD